MPVLFIAHICFLAVRSSYIEYGLIGILLPCSQNYRLNFLRHFNGLLS